jgi:RimJ/RimL family protein N-acetyltransferase
MTALHDLTWPRRTDRLAIRPATAADVAACWAFRRLPEVAEWLGCAWPDEDEFATWYTGPDQLPHQLVVELDGRVVGDAMVQVGTPWTQWEVADRAQGVEATLAWNLDPAVQGRGYATEVGAELLAIAFDGLGLRRVVAECFADNLPSRRVMARLGLRPEARNVRDSLHRDRGWLDGMTYALLADEWREGLSADADPLAAVAWPRRTERLLIRRGTAADAAVVWRYAQHPVVTEWETNLDADEEAFSARWSHPDKLPVRLVVERGGTIIGDLMLKVGDALGQTEVADRGKGVEAEIGWSFDPDHHGQGYATEAAEDLLRICFDELGLRRVVASCFADNTPSWRLMERIGLRRELASKEEALHRTRGWLDGYQYALLATEWRSRTRT